MLTSASLRKPKKKNPPINKKARKKQRQPIRLSFFSFLSLFVNSLSALGSSDSKFFCIQRFTIMEIKNMIFR